MDVIADKPDDLDVLHRLIRRERNAKQRDRYRAVLLALQQFTAQQIVMKTGRSRRFVQAWVYRYREQGLEGIRELPRSGQPPKLKRELEEKFKARISAGPRPEDGACTLRGRNVVRILEREFGAKYTLGGAYDLLHRLEFSCLRPRPRHEQNDPEKMRKWLESAPFLSSACAKSTRENRLKSGSRTKHASASRAR